MRKEKPCNVSDTCGGAFLGLDGKDDGAKDLKSGFG